MTRFQELHSLITDSETKHEVRTAKRIVLVACVAGEINVSEGELLLDIASVIEQQCPRKIARELLTESQIAALRSPYNEHRDNLD